MQLLAQLNNPQVLKLINDLEKKFKDVPHLPEGLRDFFVTIAPYGAVIGGIISIFTGIQALINTSGYDAVLSELGISQTGYYISSVHAIVIGALSLWAYKYLKERSFTGWLMMFWSFLISTVFSLILLVLRENNIVGIVLSVLLSLYFLFEMKPYYSKTKAVADKVKKDITN